MTTPTEPPLGRYRDLLADYRGGSIFFEELPFGNNGDLLIEMGSRHTHRESGLRYVSDPKDAHLLILRGNGSFLENDHVVLNILLRYARDYPDVPLCVEPSTFLYKKLQLKELLPARTAPLYLFARDEVSLGYLLRQCSQTIRVGLDHDLALSLHDSTFIENLRLMPVDKNLIVERMDVEHPFVSRPHFKLTLGLYRTMVPKRVREKSNPLLNRLRQRTPSRMKREGTQLLKARFPQHRSLPVVYEDVSDQRRNDFDSFVSAVGSSAVVITSRLHPGILAAMLGKPTVLLSGGYPKIRAIYEYSLSGFENVFIHSVA